MAGHPELIQALNQPTGQLESVQAAALAVAPGGCILEANESARALLGLEPRDTAPLQLDDVLISDSPGGSMEALCADYGPAIRLEATVARSPAHGIRLWLIARFDAQDRIVVVLQEQEPRPPATAGLEPVLADAAHGSALALFATDGDGRITVAVGQALADLGIDPQEVIGSSAASLPFPGVETAVWRALEGQSSAGTW